VAVKELVTGVALGLLVTQALAANRQSLSGFQNFRFGMLEQDIRRIAKIEAKSNEAEGTFLNGAKLIEINGLSYRVRFLLKGGKLYRVRLSRESTASDGQCDAYFDRVFGLVQAKYGNPDEAPERSKLLDGISTIRIAAFTFRDGGQITASATYFETDRTCTVLVAYTTGRAKQGSSF
jgi:hypothetical protein